ncbi:hypothetical protein TSAR_005735, partial [Trichomalopsis sarcophagae]
VRSKIRHRGKLTTCFLALARLFCLQVIHCLHEPVRLVLIFISQLFGENFGLGYASKPLFKSKFVHTLHSFNFENYSSDPRARCIALP